MNYFPIFKPFHHTTIPKALIYTKLNSNYKKPESSLKSKFSNPQNYSSPTPSPLIILQSF